MAARSERVAWVGPGRSQAATATSACRYTLNQIRFHLTSRSTLASVSVFCVLILLFSALPSPDALRLTGRSGLTASSSLFPKVNTSAPFPYLVSPSEYPLPDTVVAAPSPSTETFSPPGSSWNELVILGLTPAGATTPSIVAHGIVTLPTGGSVQIPALNVKAGDAVFIGWNQFATTPVTVADSEGNTYTSATATYVTTRQLGYAYVVNVAASSSLVITLHSSGSTGGANVYYVQVTGGSTSVQSSGFVSSNSATLTPAVGSERLILFGALVPVASPTLSPATYLDTSTSGTWNSFSGTDTSGSLGGLTLSQLVSFVSNTVPEFGLLYVEGTALEYQVGTYSPSTAKSILNRTTTNHLPLAWGPSQTILGGVSITGDALAASADGSVLAAAATYSGSSSVYLSSSGGLGNLWTSIGSLTGSNPQLALASSLLAVTETGSALNIETFGLSSPYGAISYSVSGAFESAVPIWSPNGAMGEEGVVATTTAGGVFFYGSVDGGRTFTATTVGSFQGNPAPSPFGAVGSTRLTGPGGMPGQVAVTVEGTTIFLLYTTSFSGRVVAATEISSNGGASWTGPWLTGVSVGSISDPRAVPSPAGDIYVTWTENSQQTAEVDQAVFAADGRVMQPAAPLPGSGGAGGPAASNPTVAVDIFQRPLYAWTATPTAGVSALGYSGAFLSPSNALGLVQAAVGGLSDWDMKPPTSAQVSSVQTSASASIYKLEGQLATPSSNPCFPSDVQNSTSSLYHILTSVPLAYVNESTDRCARLGPSVHPSSAVAPTSGPFAANTVLAVLLDWVDEGAAVQVVTSADALLNGAPSQTTPVLPPGVVPINGKATYSGYDAGVTVTAYPVNPTVGWLQTSASFPSWQTQSTSGCILTQISYSESSDSSNVTLEGGAHQQFSGEPNVYLTNLTANATSSWTFALTITYRDVVTTTNTCTGKRTSSSNTFAFGTATVAGTVTTTLRILPGPLFIYNPAGTVSVKYAWNNSMQAQSDVWLNSSGTNRAAPANASYQIPENFAIPLGGVSNPFGINYAAAIRTDSRPGGWQPGMEPSVSAGQSSSSPALSSGYGCSFILQQNHATISGFGITNLTGNTATIQWNSSVYGSGWVNAQELGVGLDWVQSAVEVNTSSPTTPYEYVVQLAGLLPLSLYGVSAITSYSNDNCLVYEASHSQAFLTSNGFILGEQDFPYDSVSKVGGGAAVNWQLSPSLVTSGTLLNGTVAYWNNTPSSQTVVVPIGSGTVPWRTGDSFQINVTPANPDQSYSVQVELNYSVYYQGNFGTFSGTFQVVSQPLGFVYQLDTTGDGLTDAEKWAGWYVPVANAPGPGYYSPPGTTWVGASPSLYATNGLVGDYIEKAFDLDPYTVDTAGSHMLDTWNLTFNLGIAGTATLPTSGFEYWYENASYNPFGGTSPVAYNLTNISASAAKGITSGDGSPWAAKALWSGTGTGSALAAFEGLAGIRAAGWLRAVTGTWDGLRTLTIEGKLSWGADPLVASNPRDGQPDGARVDPLYERYLAIASLSASLSNCGSYVPSSGTNGWAVRFWLNASNGPPELANFTQQATITSGGTCNPISGYTVSIPVNQAYQYQSLQVQLVVNNSGKLQLLPVSGAATEATVTYDMVRGAVSSYSWTGSNGISTSLAFNLQAVRAGVKAPTYLWLPNDNGTVSANPWGLKTYVGEQGFDLVVVNNSYGSTLTSDGVPFPWGSTYTVNLATGLTNFLVPRAQFLNSTLGRAILQGAAIPYTTSSNPPLIASGSGNEGGLLTGFGGANLITDLGCYWQNLAILPPGSGGICSAETGTPDASSANLRVADASNTASNSGGVPGNPTLETLSVAGAALQAVVTLNISSQNRLDLLIAGLLDNVTGGVNGTFENVALYIPSLGLPNAVLAALANTTTSSSGLYGVPQDTGFSSTSSGSVWTLLWNTLSGLVDKVVASVQTVVSVVYNAAVATLHFFENLPQALAKWGEAAVIRTVAGLTTVGKALDSALNALVGLVVTGIENALKPVLQPIVNGINAYATGLNSSLTAAGNHFGATGNVDPANISAFWRSVDGSVFLFALGVGLATQVAVTLLVPLDLGVNLVVTLMLSLLGVALLSGPGILKGLSTFSSAGITLFQNYIDGLQVHSSFFHSAAVYNTLKGLAVLGSGLAFFLAALVYIEEAGTAGGLAVGLLLVFSLIALVLDASTIFVNSPWLILFAAISSAIGVGAAVGALRGAGATLSDYIFFVVAMGGISFAIDMTVLITDPVT